MSDVRCPACGCDDLSYAGPGYMADIAPDRPDTPMVCEGQVGRRMPDGDSEGICGWRGTLEEAEDEARAHGRIYDDEADSKEGQYTAWEMLG